MTEFHAQIRNELADEYRVFYVTAWGYAADHLFGWFPKALNRHRDIFALLAYEGSRPKYLRERTRCECPPPQRATEGAKRRGEQYEVGAAWRAKQPGHSAVEPLWASAVPRRGALDRRAAAAGRAKRDPETLRRDRVRERDLEVRSRITRAGAHWHTSLGLARVQLQGPRPGAGFRTAFLRNEDNDILR